MHRIGGERGAVMSGQHDHGAVATTVQTEQPQVGQVGHDVAVLAWVGEPVDVQHHARVTRHEHVLQCEGEVHWSAAHNVSHAGRKHHDLRLRLSL